MKNAVVFSLAITLAAAHVSAQCAFNFTRPPQPSWIIINSFNSVPGNDIRQVQHMRLSNDAPGKWTTCLSVLGLPSFLGGDGKSVGVVMGTFDPIQGTFVVSQHARALNSTKDEQHLMIDPKGLVATFDRPDGAWVATRTAVTQSFGAPKKIAGLGTLVDIYPAPAPVDGQMKLFFTDKTAVQYRAFNPAAASVSAPSVVVSRPLQAGTKPIGPSPVIGGDGDAEGLWLADLVKPTNQTNTGDADMVFCADLDPATPPVMRVQRPDYTAPGGFAGGFVSFSHNISPRWHLMHSEAAWLIGDDEPIGGTADVLAAGVNFSSKPLKTFVFASFGTGAATPIRGIKGMLCLDQTVIEPLVALDHPDAEGVGKSAFPVPNNVWLKGQKIAIQGIIHDSARSIFTFTNTAWLRFK